MEMREEEVVIVGAGIAGLATAVALRWVGVGVLVLDGWEELRNTGAALGLTSNAWFALEALSVAHKLYPFYVPTQKRNGPIVVHRRKLLESLAEELPPDTIRFSSKLICIQSQRTPEGSSILRLEDNTIIKAKVLIGCDGVHSVVARWLGLRVPVHSNRSAVRGLAVFPQGHGFKRDESYQFLDQGKRAGFVPLTNEEIYWILIFDSPLNGEEIAADPKLLQKEVMENLAKDFPPAFLEVVQHADLATVTLAPLMFRYPWDLIFGHVCKGSITVAGDAMHPMTPDQGGCSALEDAVVLGRHLGNSFLANPNRRIVPVEAARAIEGYVKERRWRAAGMITGSYLSGWVQQSGSGSFMKFLRDTIFYRFLYRRLFDHLQYDCGKLPSVSSSSFESDAQNKID